MKTSDIPATFDFNELDQQPEWTAAYWELGYCIIRNVFSAEEIAGYQERMDRWYATGMRHSSTFRHGNKIMWLADDKNIGRYVRGMQWPSYEDEVLDAVRTDERLLRIVKPLIGDDLKQIINQLHWKQPGARVTWGLHRDERSRKPAESFRDLGTSYVQTGIAIDRHWADNGAMKILPRSHRLPDNDLFQGSFAGHDDTMEEAYRAGGFNTDDLIDVEMNPGDVALWGPYTVHGGGINVTEDNARRLYINGYVTAANCDRGEWAWKNGEPVPLDLARPALIQFEQVHTQTDAFYPGITDASAKPTD